jgi:hypothetical protein
MTVLPAERTVLSSSLISGIITIIIIAAGLGLLALSLPHGDLTNIPGINDQATLDAQQKAEGFAPRALK